MSQWYLHPNGSLEPAHSPDHLLRLKYEAELQVLLQHGPRPRVYATLEDLLTECQAP